MAKKILIVDDEPHVVKMLESRLRANGYNTASAGDAILAVQQARREKPDLILLDIMMPAGSGLTVIKNLKSMTETKDIPVIFITATTGEKVEQEAYELGAAHFVRKPFDSADILKKIRSLLREDESPA